MLLHSTLSICLQCCTSSAHLPLLHLSAAAPTQLPLSSHSAPSPLSCSKKAAAAPPFKGHTDWCQPKSFQLAVEPLPQNVDKLNKGQNFSGFAFPLHNLSKPGVYQLYHWFQVDSEWFDSVKCKYIICCHQVSIYWELEIPTICWDLICWDLKNQLFELFIIIWLSFHLFDISYVTVSSHLWLWS